LPRAHREHQIEAQRTLARRIRRELDRRHWSYAMLAQAMKQAGCDTASSSLQKTVTGWTNRNGERHYRPVTINEAVALSTVFNATLDDLLTDPDTVDQERVVVALETLEEAQTALAETTQRVLDAYVALFAHSLYGPEETSAMIDSGNTYLLGKAADVDVKPHADGQVTPVETEAVNDQLQKLRVLLLLLASDWVIAEDDRLNRRLPPSLLLGSMDWWGQRLHEAKAGDAVPEAPADAPQ
jgi:hypothetical protein